MRATRSLLTTLALVTALAAPASGTHGGIHPTFARDDVWFHCNGETKLYNANWLIAAGASTASVPWDRTPPAASVTNGAGCGGFDVGSIANEVYDVAYEGTFTGNLEDVTVRLYDFILNQTRESSDVRMRVYAEVDGAPLFPRGDYEASGAYTGRAFTVTPTRVNSGATDLFEFSITNLGYAIDIFDEQGELIDVETGGLALEDGPGQAEHYLKLLVGIDDFFLGDPPHGTNLWVWDTTEVPAGITFNPPTLAADRVAADLPEF